MYQLMYGGTASKAISKLTKPNPPSRTLIKWKLKQHMVLISQQRLENVYRFYYRI